MSVTYLFSLLGGLALFLYGMDMMSHGLEIVAGNKLNSIIEKLTSNLFKAILVGIGVTAVIQSSSATTVMVVGFVNASIMNIYQAVGVIMGANIGTTVTGQLVALNIKELAPLIAFIGFLVYMASNKQKYKYLGQVIIGLGFLFMGMEFMSNAMKPLRSDENFINLMLSFKNPFLGILAGMIFTAIIQSSSASLGILQAIANQGLIGLSSSMYIVCGFNIGTCITSVLSAIGTSKNAQRTAAVHVLFNLIGTMIFVTISFIVPIDKVIEHFSRNLPAAQIANMHTLFNLCTTIIMLPFYKVLANLAIKLVKGTDKSREELSFRYINDKQHADPNIVLSGVKAEIGRMYELVKVNFEMSIGIFKKFDEKTHKEIYHNEEIINYLNSNITKYIIRVMKRSMGEDLASVFSGYMRVVRDLERVGDHLKSVADYAKQNDVGSLVYSEKSMIELNSIREKIEKMFSEIDTQTDRVLKISQLKKYNIAIEEDTIKYRNGHMDRMKTGECDPESGLVFEKLLISLERVSSYLSNAGKLMV